MKRTARVRAKSGETSPVRHDPMQQSGTVVPAAESGPVGPVVRMRLVAAGRGMAEAGKRRKALRFSALPWVWAWVRLGMPVPPRQ